ncbi:MAG: haloacid dehalogenase-like hydrolase, partial [Betaproteobacteria bacterium]
MSTTQILPMRIGIDFDNTIVSYDALFHRAAVDKDLVPTDLPPSKLAVREYLRQLGREPDWTELQGYVYGPRMGEAVPFPGAVDFFRWAHEQVLDVTIVSHRTRHPFLGPQYDLHEAAR